MGNHVFVCHMCLCLCVCVCVFVFVCLCVSTVRVPSFLPQSTLDFRERHVSEADDLTDAHTMDTSTDMSADDEDGAAFAKVKCLTDPHVFLIPLFSTS